MKGCIAVLLLMESSRTSPPTRGILAAWKGCVMQGDARQRGEREKREERHNARTHFIKIAARFFGSFMAPECSFVPRLSAPILPVGPGAPDDEWRRGLFAGETVDIPACRLGAFFSNFFFPTAYRAKYLQMRPLFFCQGLYDVRANYFAYDPACFLLSGAVFRALDLYTPRVNGSCPHIRVLFFFIIFQYGTIITRHPSLELRSRMVLFLVWPLSQWSATRTQCLYAYNIRASNNGNLAQVAKKHAHISR